jgi:hypothetical protein
MLTFDVFLKGGIYMKRLLFFVVILLVITAPTQAQDTQKCDADAIKNRMNELMADYLSAQAKATDAQSALAAANDLQTGIAALTAGCANATAEATTEASDTGMPIEGKYMLKWSNNKRVCPNTSLSAISPNRPIIVKVEDGEIVMEDIFIWPVLHLTKNSDGHYFYRRNVPLDNGSTVSYEYLTSSITSEEITGTSTSFYQTLNCTLMNEFKIVLADKNVVCMVGSEQSANLRSGPGTTFDRFGTLDANKANDVVGYGMSKDGFKWWKLASGGWIRSDLVKEAGRCDKVPETKE